MQRGWATCVKSSHDKPPTLTARSAAGRTGCPASGMDFFDRQWSTYRRVVDHDLMEHQALSAATTAAIEGWLAQRPQGSSPPQMVDLGCGDLALLAPLLRRLPLGSYLGLDLSAPVLPRAAAQLQGVPYPCAWREQDLLSWALEGSVPAIPIPPPPLRWT